MKTALDFLRADPNISPSFKEAVSQELRDGIAEWKAQLKAAEQSLKERDEDMKYEIENSDYRRVHQIACGCRVEFGQNKPCIEHKAAARLLEDM